MGKKEYYKEYASRNRERLNEYKRLWRLKNYERVHPHRKEWQRKSRQQRKLWAIEYRGQFCTDCSMDLLPFPECADFDHLGNKNQEISKMYNRSRESMIKELVKCELVCANCHRKRSAQRLRSASQ